jgi:hypothetical protein
VANSTLADRPAKPTREFPLKPHKNGQWCKKVRRNLHYFGHWADDRGGERAVALWADQKDDLLAGRTPRGCRDGLSVRDLCNAFLTAKELASDAGDISQRTFADYLATAKLLVDTFGGERLVDNLAARLAVAPHTYSPPTKAVALARRHWPN